MHKALALAALVAVAAFAAGAWSAPSATPTEKNLQRRVASLEAKVSKLEKNVKALKKTDSDLGDGIGLSLLYTFCGLAVTADGLQGTWQENDQLSAATQAGKTYFGPQTSVNDSLGTVASVCQTLGVPRSTALPPTTAQITALLALLQRSSRFHAYLR